MNINDFKQHLQHIHGTLDDESANKQMKDRLQENKPAIKQMKFDEPKQSKEGPVLAWRSLRDEDRRYRPLKIRKIEKSEVDLIGEDGDERLQENKPAIKQMKFDEPKQSKVPATTLASSTLKPTESSKRRKLQDSVEVDLIGEDGDERYNARPRRELRSVASRKKRKRAAESELDAKNRFRMSMGMQPELFHGVDLDAASGRKLSKSIQNQKPLGKQKDLFAANQYFNGYFGENLNEDTSDADIMDAVYDLVDLTEAVCDVIGLDEAGIKKMQRQKIALDKQTKKLKATQPGWQGNSPAERALDAKKKALGARAEYKIQSSGGKEYRNIENLRTKAVSGEGGVKPPDVIKRKRDIEAKRDVLSRLGTRTKSEPEKKGWHKDYPVKAIPSTAERIKGQIKSIGIGPKPKDKTPPSEQMQRASSQIKRLARRDREAVTADKFASGGSFTNLGRRIKRLARKATGRKIPTYHGGNKPGYGMKKYGEPIRTLKPTPQPKKKSGPSGLDPSRFPVGGPGQPDYM